MRKLIIKTALITLAIIIGACAITLGALLLFSPKTIGDIADKANNYSFAMYCYKLQYNKSEDIEDLGNIVRIVDENEDATTAVYYCELIKDHSEFTNYCVEIDAETKADENDNVMKEAEYIYSKYAVALINVDRFDTMVDVCKNYCTSNGYSMYSPFSAVIANCGENLTVSELTTIKQKLRSLKNVYLIYNSGDQLDNINTDINDIDDIISTKGE